MFLIFLFSSFRFCVAGLVLIDVVVRPVRMPFGFTGFGSGVVCVFVILVFGCCFGIVLCGFYSVAGV